MEITINTHSAWLIMSLIIIFVLSRSDSNLISTNATKGLLLELVVKLKQLLEHGYFQKFITVFRRSFFDSV